MNGAKSRLSGIRALRAKYLSWHVWLSRFLSVFRYVFLMSVAIVFLFPFLFMFITSITSPLDLADPTVTWIPRVFFWQNYAIAFNLLNYATGMRNSAVMVSVATLGHLFSCSFIAYGFARYRFPFRRVLFMLVVLSIIVPVQTLIITQYRFYASMGFINSIVPLLLPTFFGYGLRGALYIFIFRQFYLSMPKELEDAAEVDGCGGLRTFFRIILPASRSSMVVCAVLSIVWHWNDYYEPNIYLNELRKWPVTSMLPEMYIRINNKEAYDAIIGSGADFVGINEGVTMAATVLVILPVLLAFFFIQRQFMQGVERSGIVE